MSANNVPILPPPNLSTTIEMIKNPHEASSSLQNDPNHVEGLTNPNQSTSSTTRPNEHTKKSIVSSPRGQQYTAKRVFKVIIIGDANVGKTCLSFRFCNNRFPAQTESTIGVDFRERTLVLEGELIRVQLWDTAGQERYRQSIVAHYYRNVNAVVFVYDMNNLASFNSLPIWINECKKHNITPETVPHVLVGNKCDLESTTKVPTDAAQVFADKNNLAFFETSAKVDSEADHVEAIFMTLVIKLQQNKTMHVQTEEEKIEKQTLLLKANDAKSLEDSAEGWCC